jgi:hypothetical protein
LWALFGARGIVNTTPSNNANYYADCWSTHLKNESNLYLVAGPVDR